MRFRAVLSQFQADVDRVDNKRATWSALTALWQQGLKPNVHCLVLNEQTVTLLKEAIDSACRHQATRLAGDHLSPLYQRVPHRALDRLVFRSSLEHCNIGGRSGSSSRKGASSHESLTKDSCTRVHPPYLPVEEQSFHR